MKLVIHLTECSNGCTKSDVRAITDQIINRISTLSITDHIENWEIEE